MWDTVALYGLRTDPQTLERMERKGWTEARGGLGFEVKEFVYSFKIEKFTDPSTYDISFHIMIKY